MAKNWRELLQQIETLRDKLRQEVRQVPPIGKCVNWQSGCGNQVEAPEVMCDDCKDAARVLSQTIEIEDEQDSEDNLS